MILVNFTKEFDLVNREALWVIVKERGCATKFVNILKLGSELKHVC